LIFFTSLINTNSDFEKGGYKVDIMEKKMRFDIKTLAAEPALFYGKLLAVTVGAFLLGRHTK